jgi:ATP-binding cassette subfamily F protein 3
VGWFHQHQIEAMDGEDTPLGIFRRSRVEATETQARSALARFGMTADKAQTRVVSLSGGERARLLLNLVAMQRPHLLILDEPTNHLDIDSRRALTEALNDYEGAVILITHDRSLMELVADRLWLAAGGTIKPFDGDMNDYAKFVLDKARVAARAPTQVAAEPAPAPKPVEAPRISPRDAAAQAGPLKRKLEAAEAVLARETKAVAELDAILTDPALYTRDPARAAEVGRKRAKQQDALDRAEALWMAAAEAYEAVVAAAG